MSSERSGSELKESPFVVHELPILLIIDNILNDLPYSVGF